VDSRIQYSRRSEEKFTSSPPPEAAPRPLSAREIRQRASAAEAATASWPPPVFGEDDALELLHFGPLRCAVPGF